jgi:Mg-chelatase subunit ChlD
LRFRSLRQFLNFLRMGLKQLLALAIAHVAAFAGAAQADIAAAARGGAVVRFSAGATNVASLHDAGRRQKPYGAPAVFPQEVVFAFRDDAEALVDHVVLKNRTNSPASDRPRRVAIAVSTNSPLDGFEEVSVASLEEDTVEEVVPVRRRARFVAVRVLENFGGRLTSLQEVRVIEGTAPGYVSILQASNAPVTAAGPAPRDDHEPNNSPAQAKPFSASRAISGAINPPGDEDWFNFKVSGRAATAVTFSLDGRPNIRTSLALLRGTEVVKQFDPGRRPVEHEEFSWVVEPGDYFLRFNEPAASIVLIWDSSTSMRGSETNLQRAVRAFLSQCKAPDRLKLVQFSGKIDVLNSNWLSDPDELLALFNQRYKLDKGTAFFDAIRRGIELLDQVEGNRAIVVMTDGADSQSKTPYAQFWRELEEKRIRLYTVGLGKELARFTDKMGGTSRRMLRHIALASNGRYLFTENPDELLKLYQRVSDELHNRSSYQLGVSMSRGQGSLAVSAVARRTVARGTPAPLEFIFDASGSMREKIDHRRKIEIMRDVMTRTIDSLADDQTVALRVFGHRVDSQKPAALTDSELIFKPGRIDKAALRDTIQKLQPRGTTPIAHSLAQLTNDLAGIPGEKHVVLVTDGREEAGGDPVEVVKELLASGLKFRLNVVGFALAEQAGKDQMKTIAELTGGRFYDATSAAGLRDAVEQSVVEEVLRVPFEVRDGAGAKVLSGTTGDKVATLPEGVFNLHVQTPGRPVNIPSARVEKGRTTRLVLTREGEQFVPRTEISDGR